MRKVIAIGVFLAVLTQIAAERHFMDYLKNEMEECIKEMGVDGGLRQLSREHPEKAKCLLKCVMDKKGLFKDGSIDAAKIIKSIEKNMESGPRKDKILKVIEECSKEVGSEKDMCETASKFMACRLEKMNPRKQNL